jgi:hypothetical protein
MALLLRNGAMPQFKLRPTQFEQGRTFTIPAPYGGLNLRDDITALKPNEARVLENWLPSTGFLALRSGAAAHASSLGSGEVMTLAAFDYASSSKLIAGANGKLYDVSSFGIGTQIGIGFSENRWQTAVANNRVFLVNGTDAPQDYDATTLTSTSWTGSGLTIANLVNVALVRNRLWFCENDSADVWYAGIASVTGALTKFQLSQIASGGHCMAIGSWSRDAGDGSDDFTVFVMSTGEIIVYQGDPATTFAIVGKFAGAPPLGRRCLAKVGGELIVITRLGLLPVSAAIGGVALDLARIDPWGKIAPGIASDAALYGSNDGWSGTLHLGLLYINVPQTTGTLSKQYVLNTRTGAWTIFKGWNASSFASFGNSLYFGGQTGGVVRKVSGSSDTQVGVGTNEASLPLLLNSPLIENALDITAVANGAFTTPQNGYRTNMFTAVRPKFEATGNIFGKIGVDVDYLQSSLNTADVQLVSNASATPWGSAWGSAWANDEEATQTWFSTKGQGRAVAVALRLAAQTSDLRWFASDVLFKPGGIR